jgi:hypothetical protein
MRDLDISRTSLDGRDRVAELLDEVTFVGGDSEVGVLEGRR